jgi:small ligand-binding sensory domain FIST
MLLALKDTKLVTGQWDLSEIENGRLDVPEEADQCSGWIVLSNPFIFDTEQWLSLWNKALPGNVTIGGLASGGAAGNEVVLFHNHPVDHGAIGIGFQGPVRLGALVSQGCRPIGDPLTITRAQGNILLRLGAQPAYEVLQSAWEELGEKERVQAQGNLFVGIASSEYVEEFTRGDFLVRNILGADPKTGAVAIGGFPRVGQTLQYQLRDPQTAHEDLVEISEGIARKGPKPFASLLFTCTGRGSALFGQKGHDAEVLQQRLGEHPMAGFFCNGEVGPVGGLPSLHGYTASAALFY